MKDGIYTVLVVVATALVNFLGGADSSLKALAVLMLIDYLSGLVVAFVFKNSPKSSTGGLNSTVGFKGIFKKFFMVAMVGVANILDGVLGTNFVRTGVVFTLLSNETISIIENAGLMGVPVPKVVSDAIDILKEKEYAK